MRKQNLITLFIFSFIILYKANLSASESTIKLDKAPIDSHNKASLQRGFKTFVNSCLSCHSAKYLRYKDVARDLGIVDQDGEVLATLVQRNLNFVTDKVTDNIKTSMPAEAAEKWFGVTPPDLSLIARSRGVDWLYTYLRSFYADDTRPFGVNNLVFKDVGMPHVFLAEQGLQRANYKVVKDLVGEHKEIESLELVKPGTLVTVDSYDRMIADLVNFIDYMGEPVKIKRKHIGTYVILFLIVFVLVSYMLKREYWKDIYGKSKTDSEKNHIENLEEE